MVAVTPGDSAYVSLDLPARSEHMGAIVCIVSYKHSPAG